VKKCKWCKYGLIAAIFVWLSWFCRLTIYPCKSAPVVLNPVYKWGVCRTSILANWVGVHNLYFGFEQGRILALILNVIIACVVVYLGVYLYKKYKK
jgi:hypothetical protein